MAGQELEAATHRVRKPLGDIVDKVDMDARWRLAQEYMFRFDSHVPYGIAVGNHDMEADGNSSQFQRFFPASHFQVQRWYGGTCRGDPDRPGHPSNNANSYQLFSAEGYRFVILHLECNAPDIVVAWANQILDRYKDRLALISTHMDLGLMHGRSASQRAAIESRSAPIGRIKWSKCHGDRGNSPLSLWDKLYRKHPNLLAVFSADQATVCSLYEMRTGDQGNIVHFFMSDYGKAVVKLYRFLPSEKTIQVLTYDTMRQQLVDSADGAPEKKSHQFRVRWNPTPTGRETRPGG